MDAPPPQVLVAAGHDPRAGLFWTFTPLFGAGEALLHAYLALPPRPPTRREDGGRIVAFDQAPLLGRRLREARFMLRWPDLQIVDPRGVVSPASKPATPEETDA